MPVSCPHCGAANRDTAKFCPVCGNPLPAPLPQPAPTSSAGYPPIAFTPGASLMTGEVKLIAADGQAYPLIGSHTLVGRNPGSDVQLASSEVSGQHARIDAQGGVYKLTDLNSSNGTRVNGMAVTAPRQLVSGDRIAFGSEEFTLQVGAAATVHMSLSQPVGQVVQHRSRFGALFGPRVVGEVTNTLPPQQEQPPTDMGRLLVTISVTLMFVSALFGFIMAVLPAAIILIICGGGALLFIIPFLFMPLQMLFGGIMSWLRDDKPVMAVHFSVQDGATGSPVEVVLYRKPGSPGNVQLGDKVQIWGGRLGGAAIRATRVRIVERGGASANIPIPAKRPWPIWVGLMMLAGLIGSALYLAASMGLI